MKKLLFVVTVFFSIGLIVSPANAEYLPEYDKTISVETNPQVNDLIPLSEETANEMFEFQESIQQKITEKTGIEIDHSYIWIELNGEKVIAADPPIPLFN